MLSRRNTRLVVFAAAAVTVGGALFTYVTPASTNVNPAPIDQRLGTPGGPTIEPWSNYLSEGAVDSGRIEHDLDGNASALFASDQ